MPITITWYGHATWLLEIGADRQHRVLLDPFFNDNPAAPVKASQVDADTVLISHGHFDHVADAAEIANRCGATLIANYEIANWFANQHGVQSTIGMNLGGELSTDFGQVKMTNALHSSQLPDGSYGGNPSGFLLNIDQQRIYFACDTALFSDMQQIGQEGLDLAVLPIGDLFTMGIQDSLAAIELLQPKQVLPTHYNTWPPIEQNADVWAQKVRARSNCQPFVLLPGQSHSI